MQLLTAVEDGPKGATSVYRVSYNTSGEAQAPGNPKNLYESFENTVNAHAEYPCLGWRPVQNGQAQDYSFMSYGEVHKTVSSVGSALKAVGVQRGSAVGVYAVNSPEWMMTMKAADFCGGMTVPLYDTFGADAVEYIIKHSGLKVIFVSTDKLSTIAKVLPAIKDQITQVVVWSSTPGEEVDSSTLEEAEQAGIPVMEWGKFVALGASKPEQATPGDFTDLCTIMYTSGTTGAPKGVEISHEAVITSSAALLQLVGEFGVPVGKDDVFLSYLPLAHIFDRVAEETFLCIGGRIGYWQGNVKRLMDDVGALKPTIFVGVPRIFDRIYTGVSDKVKTSSTFKRMVFNASYSIKSHFVKLGRCTLPIVDGLAFKAVQQRLGGRVRLVVSGGAPLANHVEEFLKVTLCCPVAQGYGLTETCAASFIANPFKPEQATTVGAPVSALQVCLKSIPDMGYDATAEPPKGEVCVRGPAVFTGYHKEPEKTAEVLVDGWFHTGDVGMFCDDGSLKIIDRKKNFFKLSHGEYVAAEKIENVYKKSTFVDQIWVYGDSEKAQLVAVVVPAEAGLLNVANDIGKSGKFMELCADTDIASEVQNRLEAAGREDGLKGFEIVKKIHLFAEGFSVENDLMTPSFKLKRPQLKTKFSDVIQHMYSTLS
eukprot:jgi/Ulvmu1/7287/UM035_0075.1